MCVHTYVRKTGETERTEADTSNMLFTPKSQWMAAVNLLIQINVYKMICEKNAYRDKYIFIVNDF